MRARIAGYLAVALVPIVYAALYLAGGMWAWLGLVPGILSIFVIPGWLIATHFRIKTRKPSELLLYAAGLSIAFFYVLGLTLNTLLPMNGVQQPLLSMYLVPSLVGSILVMLLFAYTRGLSLRTGVHLRKMTATNIAMLLAPVLIVACSIMGAVSLNNFGSNFLALAAMAMIGIYVAVLLWLKDKVSDGVYSFSLYAICLSLLLAVSLRGWEISGHDILTEYYIFQLTAQHHLWSMSFFKDAYNACLSVSLMPAMISQMLPIADQYIFRFLYQALVALTAVALFLFARNFLRRAYAYIAIVFFMTQSPFLRDFPYLIRQEVATLLYTILFVAIFSKSLSVTAKKWLFCILGLAMVFSHYSTTYVAVGVFVLWGLVDWLNKTRLFWSIAEFVSKLSKRFKRISGAVAPSFEILTDTVTPAMVPKYLPSALLVVLLLSATLVWNVAITRTASNLASFTKTSIATKTTSSTIAPATSEGPLAQFSLTSDTASGSDLARSFQASTTPDPTATGLHYPATTYEGYNVVQNLNVNLLPVVNGKLASAISAAGSIVQKLMKVFIIVGVFWMLVQAYRKRHGVERDIANLAVVNLVALAAALFLPALSTDYDLARMYQQLLVVLCIPAVIGACVCFWYLKPRARYYVVGSFFVLYYFFVSPVIPQLIGSGAAQLQLNNFGLYYNLYLTRQTEVSSIQWLDAHGDPNIPTFADWYATKKIVAFSSRPVWVIDNVLPKDITTDSYVYEDYTNTKTGTAYVFYDGEELNYAFPTQFVQQNKDVIYSNGSTEILR